MKRLSIIMSVFIALAVAAPSFAIEFDATGTLKFQGAYNQNSSSNMSNKDKAGNTIDDKADSYRDMRLRVRTELKVTDKITLVTRFDALDKVLSSSDSAIAAGEDDDNIDFDRAYMEIVSPIGLFVIGRQEGVTWGTTWADDEADTDRIKYVLPIPVGDGDDKFYVGIVAEKVSEEDKGYAKTDKDNDKYYISGTYVSEIFRSGLLLGFYDFRTFQDPGQATMYKAMNDAGGAEAVQLYANHNAMALGAGASAALRAAGIEAAVMSQATDQAIETAVASAGEGSRAAITADYKTALGQETIAALAAPTIAGAIAEDDDYNAYSGLSAKHAESAAAYAPAYAAYSTFAATPRGTSAQGKVFLLAPYFTGKFGDLGITTELDYVTGTIAYKNSLVPTKDRDVSAYSFFFETTYDAGPMGFQAGFATVSGDTDFNDDDIGSMGYVSPGVDWAKMFILSADDHGMNTTLGGGMGNHVGNGFGTANTTLLAGYQMFYIGADFDLNETMNIETIMCMSKADDAPTGYDDDQGYEVDVNFSWKIMDNLTYSSKIAYLAAGDYWKGAGEAGKGDDTTALFHKLELTF